MKESDVVRSAIIELRGVRKTTEEQRGMYKPTEHEYVVLTKAIVKIDERIQEREKKLSNLLTNNV